jgi:hypothetical protein
MHCFQHTVQLSIKKFHVPFGGSKRGSELPEELRHKQSRLARIRQARKEMEAETAAATSRQQQ